MAANSVIDRILSTLERVWVDVRQRYTDYYDIDDFDDDDLINKRAAKSIISSPSIPILIDIPHGSSIPFIFDMTPYIDFIGHNIPRPVQILDDTPGSRKFKYLNDVDIISNPDSSPPTLEIYGHPDPDNTSITIDDIFINIYKV